VIDDKIMHAADTLAVAYRPDDSLDTGLAADSVRDFVCRQKPLPHEVVLQDYNYRKATVQLKARATVSDAGIGEVMLYGENFRDQQEGDRYAKLRAQELVCGGKVYSGEGTALGLRSGFFFTLGFHYRDDFNGRYLVTEVHHQGSQAGALLNGVTSPYSEGARGGEIVYRNSFRAIPAATQFRPERVTAKPRVAGTMNATIDSEGSGEYAELDEYGQYKVQLPFDKTDKNANKSSARLRMASPYAGTDHGMHFPLHKDAEVLLSFIDGDPDQPVIVGSLANSENSNVVTQQNAQANRIATAGGNQLHMTDSKGKEAVWLHSPFHNSTIGIGSTDVNGGGSLWTSTAGSSESVTVGVSNSLFAGTKNSLTLSYEGSLSASMTTKASFGANVSFGLSTNVSWNKGKSITVDDSDTVSLKTSGKLQGGRWREGLDQGSRRAESRGERGDRGGSGPRDQRGRRRRRRLGQGRAVDAGQLRRHGGADRIGRRAHVDPRAQGAVRRREGDRRRERGQAALRQQHRARYFRHQGYRPAVARHRLDAEHVAVRQRVVRGERAGGVVERGGR
jgi:type VI secretion system secreted protein VgrG